MSVYRFYGFYVHNWDDEAMAGCVMTTLRSHDLVRRPIYVGFPALRAAARWATEWRAISLGFESVWKCRDTSNLGSSAIMKLLIIPCRTLAYISSICDSQNISFVQLSIFAWRYQWLWCVQSAEPGSDQGPVVSADPGDCGWLWLLMKAYPIFFKMMLRCKVSSWVPLLVAQSSHTKGGRWHPMMYQIL